MTGALEAGRAAGRAIRRAIVIGIALVAAACAFPAPGRLPAGTSIDEARRAVGGPRGQYPLPGGGTRLEFSGFQETYMLDFDAGGRLVASRQVLTEADFATITPGLPREQVLMRIGHPTWVFGVGRQRLSVWNYRFRAPLGCVIFQVSVSDAGAVIEASTGYDPICDAPSARD